MKFGVLLAAVFALALVTTQAATFTVTSTADSGPQSLRQAILDANATPGDDTIVFTANGTILLITPLPLVTNNTFILGPGTNQLTISGNNAVQAFSFNAGTTNTLSDLTIANGLATGYINGAGIANDGTLSLLNCALVNNTNLGGWGGGVYNSGNLEVVDSAFSGNAVIGENGYIGRAGGGGGAGIGGAICTMSGNVILKKTRFNGNTASGGNGGNCASVDGGRGGGLNGGNPLGTPTGGFGGGGAGGPYASRSGGAGGFGGGGGGGGGSPGMSNPGGPGTFGGGAGGTGSVCSGSGGGGGGLGGAIFVYSGNVMLTACVFTNNQAIGGQAGALPLGGGGQPCAGPATNGTGIGPDFFNYAGKIAPTLTTVTRGGGSVTVDPPASPYLNNSLATVTAQPVSGWTFLQWLGDGSGTNSQLDLYMDRNKYLEAVFGTTLSCSSGVSASPQLVLYPFGTVAKLTVIPSLGQYFIAWSGDAAGTNNPLSLSITAPNPSISCQLGTLSLGETSLTVVENGKGRVALFPSKYRYYISETAGLIPVPDPGQEFTGWSGDATGTQTPLLVSMAQSKIITANFTKRPSLKVGTPLEGMVEGGFRLTLSGEFDTLYAILGSTNLIDWTAIGTVTNTYGTTQLTDSGATNLPHRFYRAVSQ